MKKICCLLLVVAIISMCLVGCESSDYDDGDGIVTRKEALEKAKQKVVNKLCGKEGVSKVRIFYGTEHVVGILDDDYPGDDVWRIKLAGTYHTVNEYGSIGSEKEFSYVVEIDKNDGKVLYCG